MNTPQHLPYQEDRFGKLFRLFAKISWLSLIVAAVLLIGALINQATSDSRIGPGMISNFLMSTGILSGMVALLGIPRYGRRAILWPALTGLILWVVLSLLVHPALMKAREMTHPFEASTHLAPLKTRPGAIRITDTKYAFSIDVPSEFTPFTEFSAPGAQSGIRHAYCKPSADGTSKEVFMIKPLGVKLARQHLEKRDLPANLEATLIKMDWRGTPIDAVRIPAVEKGLSYLTYNVRIPLEPEGIQIAFGAPASVETELKARIEEALDSLEGATNW